MNILLGSYLIYVLLGVVPGLYLLSSQQKDLEGHEPEIELEEIHRSYLEKHIN